jgi:hypothetical protein
MHHTQIGSNMQHTEKCGRARRTLPMPVSRQLQQFLFSRTPGQQQEGESARGIGQVRAWSCDTRPGLAGTKHRSIFSRECWTGNRTCQDFWRRRVSPHLNPSVFLFLPVCLHVWLPMNFPFSSASWQGYIPFQKPGRSMSSCTLWPLPPH